MFWAWLLSLSGAALFFAAGDVWSKQRKARGEAQSLSSLGAELEATRAHMLDQEQKKQELRAHEAKLSGELSQRHSAFDQLRNELTQTRTQSAALEQELLAARAELRKTSERAAALSKPPAPIAASGAAPSKELERAKHEQQLATKDLKRAETERELLTQQLERLHTERELLAKQLEAEQRAAERKALATTGERMRADARMQELTNRAAPDAQTAALQQELALTRESLRSRDLQVEQLREETVRLRRVEVELERSKRDLAELAEQTRSLRAEAYASHAPPRKRSDRPVTVSTRGNALQLIVDNETENGRARSAVIADELGLLVAASGVGNEYDDALAAFGAYLADVGLRTRDVLPLHEVRQVVVRDDRDMTLTVRPLATEEAGLALVTLAVEVNTAAQAAGAPYLR